MKHLHHLLAAITLSLIPIASQAQTDTVATAGQSQWKKYLPHVHGVIRARFEASTVEDACRFQVRNARLSLGGDVGSMVSYCMQADFCDRGKMKMLDAWVGITPLHNLNFRAGQFRVPFGVDAFLAPATYIFANRSYLVKYGANYRAVGLRASYLLPRVPVTLEAGAFNPGTIDDHQPWSSSLTFASKATIRSHGFTASVGYLSHRPQSRRINYFDAAIGWKNSHWTLNAEYLYSHPVNMGSRGVAHAYLVQSDYAMPLRTKFFNRLSFQGRFDGRTDAPVFSVDVSAPQPASIWSGRNRITLGSTISHIHTSDMQLHLRVNYEKMFHHSGIHPTADDGDKALVELVLSF